MRITLMGELADGTFELIWADGDLRGTPRLVERFRPAAESAGDDVLAFIRAVELGLGTRPQLIVWPDHELVIDDDLAAGTGDARRPNPSGAA